MHAVTTNDHEVISRQRLVAWINTHDCGVTPTAVLRDDGAIDVRDCDADGKTYTTVVRTLGEARDALGY